MILSNTHELYITVAKGDPLYIYLYTELKFDFMIFNHLSVNLN